MISRHPIDVDYDVIPTANNNIQYSSINNMYIIEIYDFLTLVK